MGSGKSTIGRILANELNYKQLDTDSMIERISGKSIADLFNSSESYFRTWEHTVCKGFPRLSNHVISTGGGIIVQQHCRDLLQQSGRVIYLKISAAAVLDRLKDDQRRPLLQKPNRSEIIENLLQEREALYNSTCHHCITVDELSKDDVIAHILALLEQ